MVKEKMTQKNNGISAASCTGDTDKIGLLS